MMGWIARTGELISQASEGAGYSLALFIRTSTVVGALVRPHYRAALYRQLFICGVTTIPVVLIVSVFTGMILALNGGITLADLGQEALIAQIVTISMTREMGPFMTGLILAASIGSAMASELGTMKVSEEIDALEIMAVEPAKFLVLPRLIAMAIVTPMLTVYTSLVGILGAALVTKSQYGVSYLRFRSEAFNALTAKDMYTGLLKAFIFGIVIAIVGCSQGLRTRGGAIGVGLATRRAVVISYLLIIVLGYYVTFIFFRIQW